MRPRMLLCLPLGAASLAAAAFLALAPAGYGRGTIEAREAEERKPEPRAVNEPSSVTEPSSETLQASPWGLNADSPLFGLLGAPVPTAAEQGNGLVFSLSDEGREAFSILYNAEGRPIARTKGFQTGAPVGENGDWTGERWVFIMGIPAAAQAGQGRLETVIRCRDGSVLYRVEPFTIIEKTFNSEEIRLNTANAAIRKDYGPERLRQIDRLNEILFRSNPDAPRFMGPWKLPAGEARRSAQFYDQRTYRYPRGPKETTYHYGIDFAVPRGTPVFSSGDGRVVLAEARISTGWSVVIEHLPGTYSLYYHLDSLAASEGEFVRAGTLIGHSGSTGLSTGPHLHWEFRINGEAVSPDWFLGMNAAPPREEVSRPGTDP